jgi:ribonuclease-3
VARPALVSVARAIDLGARLAVPPSESRAGVRERDTVLADAVEAVIGALFLDGGLNPARRFVRAHFASIVGAQARPPMPAKTMLQEWLAARALPPPEYRVAHAVGPAHAPSFTVAVAGGGAEGEATAATKRAAEEAAAAVLLARLGAAP